MATTGPAAARRVGTGTRRVTRLISGTGAVEPATPRDVEQRLAAGGVFWLDLESPDDERLEQFARSLRLEASGTRSPAATGQSPDLAMLASGVAQRPSVAVGDYVQALVPAAGAHQP